MTPFDPFNLNRFIGAQESFYIDALQEINHVCVSEQNILLLRTILNIIKEASDYETTKLRKSHLKILNEEYTYIWRFDYIFSA